MRVAISLACASVLVLASPLRVLADGSGIVAHHGRVYETKAAGAATQGFIEIDNATATSETLTGIDCPIADTSLLVGENGMVIRQLPVVAGSALILSPQGPHILLQSTHFSIDRGGAIPCTLFFGNAGAILTYLYATPAP